MISSGHCRRDIITYYYYIIGKYYEIGFITKEIIVPEGLQNRSLDSVLLCHACDPGSSPHPTALKEVLKLLCLSPSLPLYLGKEKKKGNSWPRITENIVGIQRGISEES